MVSVVCPLIVSGMVYCHLSLWKKCFGSFVLSVLGFAFGAMLLVLSIRRPRFVIAAAIFDLSVLYSPRNGLVT